MSKPSLLFSLWHSCAQSSKKLLLVAFSLFIATFVLAQEQLRQTIKGEKGVSKQFAEPAQRQEKFFNPTKAKETFGLDPASALVLKDQQQDELGMVHYRYYQTYNGIPVENSMYTVHTKNGELVSMNGTIVVEFAAGMQSKGNASLNAKQAITAALNYVKAEKYAWEDDNVQERIKLKKGRDATYYPVPEKVWYSGDGPIDPAKLKLVYKVDVYSLKPLDRKFIYVDAATGHVLGTKPGIIRFDVSGTANTAYSGSRIIHSDSIALATYRLRDNTKGKGIITRDAVTRNDYISTSKNWNLSGQAQFALDAHFGVSATWTFYKDNFNRNSVDNNGFALLSWVNDTTTDNRDNAYWDLVDHEMVYGKRSTNGNGVTALDITGHELTHGLTQFTSGLIYSFETGALNESMSDIMGKSVQFYTKPDDINWILSNDMGWEIRDMANPKSKGDPNTYKGKNWYFGTNNSVYVHTNSGVGNFMFYLLVNGGAGMNDLNNTYCVKGIGLEKAYRIIYRSNVVYLSTTSVYEDWRTACIKAATDLYGESSNEVKQVKNAWYAVGVGKREVDIEFVIDDTGSMSEEIGSVRNSLIRILNSPIFTSGDCYVFQLTTFKDGVSIRRSTTDLNEIRNQVSALVASGGGDCPEASVEAVKAITDSVREGGIIFLATDASPHPGLDIEGAKNALVARNIRVYTILSGDCSSFATLAGAAGTQQQQIPYSDNHDPSVQTEIPTAAGISSNPTAIEAFSYLSEQTGGVFAFVPEVNNGTQAGRTLYENTAYNIIFGGIAPAITSVQLPQAPRGGVVAVTVNGSNTNFNSTTTLHFDDAGVHITVDSVVSSTKILATVTVDAGVALGFKSLTATTTLAAGTEVAPGIGVLEVISAPVLPTITGISPASGQTGADMSVKVTGINTHFNASSVLNLGPGIAVITTSALNANELEARIRIDPGATLGFRSVVVTTGTEVATENVPGPFLVTAGDCVTPVFGFVWQICANTPAINLNDFVSPTGGTFSGTGVVGTTFNPAIAGLGDHLITYTYGSGACVRAATRTITVHSLPVPVITASDELCNKLVLTASSTSAPPFLFEWYYNGSFYAATPTIKLDNTSPDGQYSLRVTDNNGCQNAPLLTYTYRKEDVVNNYTLIAFKELGLDKNNNVQSGSVGVTSANGKASFDKNSSVAGAGAFVKAKNIQVTNPVNIPNRIFAPATVTLPAMQYNTTNVAALPSTTVNQNTTVTLNGNFNGITIKKGAVVTLNGNTFGKIMLQEGARLIFTQPVINLVQLQVGKGAKVSFTADAKLLVKEKVMVEENARINEAGRSVTFYVDNAPVDDQKFMIKADNVFMTANVYIPQGQFKLNGGGNNNATSYLTGLFIAEEIKGQNMNIVWNNHNCASAELFAGAGNVVAIAPGKEEPAVIAEGLTVTAYPNPSQTSFTLSIKGNAREPVTLRLLDAYGRQVESRAGLRNGVLVTTGAALNSGVYYAEVMQGKERRVIKLVKLR